MITITALKWVPPFAQGSVRDHRLRWLLKEVGWPYKVELIDPNVQKSDAYRAEQPFGQVPVLREDGRPPLFETGAIVLDVASRSGKLLPEDEGERAQVVSWVFAALNSIEPFLSNVALADFFFEDEALKAKFRPLAVKAADERVKQLAASLGDRQWLVGDDFSAADLITASVLKILSHTKMVEESPNLAAYRDRCWARPAYREAIAEQCADFEGYGPEDMGWPSSVAGKGTERRSREREAHTR